MKTELVANVVFLPAEESGSRGFIRSKSGWLWQYTPDTARKRAAALEANCFDGPIPAKISASNKYTNEKRKEDNERVKRSYGLKGK